MDIHKGSCHRGDVQAGRYQEVHFSVAPHQRQCRQLKHDQPNDDQKHIVPDPMQDSARFRTLLLGGVLIDLHPQREDEILQRVKDL